MLTIETINLTKKFKSVLALDNVSIQVNEGEVFGLLGPNGAGKTTLLKLLAGIILPTSGKAFIMGYDIVREEHRVKPLIGMITGEERSFYWRLTGRQNLTFFSSLYNLKAPKIKSRIDYLSEILEIEPVLDRKFMEYSTGIKQRFSIARSLLHNPPIILIDELTKSLDHPTVIKLRKFIKEQLVGKENKTVILTTHHIHEAETLCDRIAILDKGKIKVCDSMKNLKNNGITLEKLFVKNPDSSAEVYPRQQSRARL